VVQWSEFLAADPGPGFGSWRYPIFWVAVDLERGPLSLVKINEELHEKKIAGLVYKTEINGRSERPP
jgi:hypothetical protein